MIAGSDWTDAGRAALKRFVEANHLPVAAAFRFNDMLDNNSASYVGEAGVAMRPHVADAITRADLIIGLGIRFGEMTTGAYRLFDVPDANQEIIHVHPSDRELGKVVQAGLPVQAHPSECAEALARVALTPSAIRISWCDDLRRAHLSAAVPPTQPGALDMGAVMDWLQDELPEDVIIANGAGNFATWPNKHFSFGEFARLLAPQSGSMGYGLPAAIAAKIAFPDRLVVCFAGDGDFQMTMQELGTATQAGAQPIVLVINNGMYGTIRMHQELSYPARVSGTEIVNPDFVQLAESFGFYGERVATTEEFASAFGRARASDTGAVLELLVPTEMLTPTMTIDQARRTREKFG